MDVNLSLISDSNYDPSYDLLLDFSRSMAIVYRIDILEFIEFAKKNIRLRKRVKVGIIYSGSNQFYLLGVYKPLAKMLRMDVEYFRETEACLVWMGYNEHDQQTISRCLENLRFKPGKQ